MNKRTVDKDAARLQEILNSLRMSVILNFKGGVGKTTLTTSLADYIARQKRQPVLIVDCDLQANSSSALLKKIQNPTLVDVLRDQGIIDAAIRKARPNLWVLPSGVDMDLAANYITGDERKLRRLLHELLLKGGILEEDSVTRVMPHYILFDTASLNAVTKAALLCAKDMLIPIEFEYFSFQGITSLMQKITEELVRLDHGLDISGVIPFKLNERRKMTARYYRSLRNDPDLRESLYPAVHIDVKIPEAQEHTQTIFEYAPNSRGAAELAMIAQYYLGELNVEDYLKQLDAESATEDEGERDEQRNGGVK